MEPKDLTCYIGLTALYLMSVNVLLGLLMGARYNTWKRWPHRRINILKLHNWTAVSSPRHDKLISPRPKADRARAF